MSTLVLMLITACSTANPAACRIYPWTLNADITLRQCQNLGQIGLAEWASQHPGLTIRRYKCVSGGRNGGAA